MKAVLIIISFGLGIPLLLALLGKIFPAIKILVLLPGLMLAIIIPGPHSDQVTEAAVLYNMPFYVFMAWLVRMVWAEVLAQNRDSDI